MIIDIILLGVIFDRNRNIICNTPTNFSRDLASLIHRTKKDKSVTFLNENSPIPVLSYIIKVYSSKASKLWIVTRFINPRDFFQCRISRNLSLGRNDFCGKI